MECPICLDPLLLDNEYHMECKHIICKDCNQISILTAIKNKQNIVKCPLCRRKINIALQYSDIENQIETYNDEYLINKICRLAYGMIQKWATSIFTFLLIMMSMSLILFYFIY